MNNQPVAIGTVCHRIKHFDTQPWLDAHHTGVVLSVADPRAWVGSIAFPFGSIPDHDEVENYVRGHWDVLKDKVPVYWSFGKIYWEPVGSLVTEVGMV